MKKFISLLFISALSASIALIAYNELFITELNDNSGSIAKTNTFPVNYINAINWRIKCRLFGCC